MATYPDRLFHRTPGWVPDAAIFHVRIRVHAQQDKSLTDPQIVGQLIDSIHHYHQQQKWSCYLFVILPDHLHGLFSFAKEPGMSRIVADWKRYHRLHIGVRWQANYFDHRIRDAAAFSETYAYLERNPVALGICDRPEDWPHRGQAMSVDDVPKF